jgi:hypothetical protein
MKKFLLILLLTSGSLLPAQSPSARAHITAHVSGCNERDSDGHKIQTCFLSMVLVDAHDNVILHDGFGENFYPSEAGKLFVTLRPGRYRAALYTARSPYKPRWEKVVTVTPGATLDLGEL